MKKNMMLIVKGMIIGLGKIIPGVSGSLIAMSLGVYEEAISKIRYFFKDIEKNIIYFIFLGSGILLSIMLGSKAILYLLENHFTPTIFLFCGLVLGVVPTIQKKITKNIKHYFTCLITMLICILLFHLKKDSIFEYSNDFLSNLQVSFIGFLEAFTMIVPGISGTALFMNLGYYHFLMQFFSNIMVIVFSSFQVVVLFGFSFLASIYLVSSMMNYLLLHKENITYSVILGFSYISIYFLLKDAIVSIHSLKDIFIGIVLLILGCVLSIKLE